ncbi:MAG TPA: M15 family metallopeptidase, partial [Candidatus Angelobacter sp.]|nr:M15 family metallopeptidase [Candidatus Angelobacter sp.]
CKFGTMSDTMKLNLEAKGFEVKTEPAGVFKNRHVITEMTFPGEVKPVKSGAEFDKAMKTPKNAAAYKKVFDSKIVYFMNSKFGQIIYKKFGLDKLTILAKGGVDQAKASIRKALGFEGIDANTPKADIIAKARDMPRFKKAFEFIDGPLAKASSKMTATAGYLCVAYNAGRGITYATKVAKIAAFVGFAMIFLNAADQIKAGDADPDAISVLGDQLTATDGVSDKSATDSRGYKMAAYGDNSGGALTDEEKKSSAGPANGALGIVEKMLAVVSIVGWGTAAAHTFCKVAMSLWVDVAESVVDLATGAVTIGIGWAISIAKKVIIAGLVSAAIGIAIKEITETIVTSVIPNLDETTTGDELGNSLFTGTAQMMGGAAASYGLKAGTQDEIRQYAIDTANIRQQQDDVARYEAKDTPFDIYNQYSFLGSIIKNTNMYAISNSSSFMSFFGNILSIIPKSLATVTSNVGAAADTKAALYGNGQCDDAALASIGVDADAFCNPSYVMSSDEMNADIDTTVDYMIDNGYIDEETGEVIFENKRVWDAADGLGWYVEKNDYKNYLDNCAYRTAPLGEQATGIESVYYDWENGPKCLENSEMLSHFRTYTMDKSVSDTMNDEEPDDPTDGSAGWNEWDELTAIDEAGANPYDPGSTNSTTNPTNTGTGTIGTTTSNNVIGSVNDNSMNIPCDSSTNEAGVGAGYNDGTPTNVRLCSLPNTIVTGSGNPVTVSSSVSGSWFDLMRDLAKYLGTNTIVVSSGFRDMNKQQYLYSLSQNGGNEAAKPGTSNHQMGFAVDFVISGTKMSNWLSQNASKYGIKNYKPEPWHWQSSG